MGIEALQTLIKDPSPLKSHAISIHKTSFDQTFLFINKYKKNRMRERCLYANSFLKESIVQDNKNNTHCSGTMDPEKGDNHSGTCLYLQTRFWFGRLKQEDVSLRLACDIHGGHVSKNL